MVHCRSNASAAQLLTFRIGHTCGDWRWCEWGMAVELLRHDVDSMAECENGTPEASIMNLDIIVSPLRSHTQVWRHPLDGVWSGFAESPHIASPFSYGTFRGGGWGGGEMGSCGCGVAQGIADGSGPTTVASTEFACMAMRSRGLLGLGPLYVSCAVFVPAAGGCLSQACGVPLEAGLTLEPLEEDLWARAPCCKRH